MKPREVLRQAGLAAGGAPVALSGGDMGEVWRVGSLVVKSHPRPPVGLYPAEARGLALLEVAGVRVPPVRWAGDAGLVVGYLEPGPPDWAGLAKQLARLHRHGAEWYGGKEQVFIGRLALPVAWGSNWRHFWIQHRIRPLLAACVDLPTALRAEIETMLAHYTPPTEGPVLIHGDLWSGNVHMSKAGAALVDPSAWVGERVVDLAMMKLFGGFPDEFWASYALRYPIPEAVAAAIPYHQLYFLLLHVHFFGRGYLHGVRQAVAATMLL